MFFLAAGTHVVHGLIGLIAVLVIGFALLGLNRLRRR
jgi:heme/copper-type cytochrome/quinol oxidase subunit 3